MNAIVNAFAEQGLILAAILLLAIYLQAKIHNSGAGLRREMSAMKDGLRKETASLSARLGRVEGLPRGSAEGGHGLRNGCRATARRRG